jgi:hypothetical protein
VPIFRAVKFLQSVLVELVGSGVNISYAERKMILYAEIFVIGICRNVQHVFDPVVTVRHLDFVPVDAIVLEAAIPIQPEAKKVYIEAIFSCGVFNDKPGVKQMCANGMVNRDKIGRNLRALSKRQRIALGITEFEVTGTVQILGNRRYAKVVRQEIAAHLLDVVCGIGYFSEPIFGREPRNRLQFDLLKRVHGKARERARPAAVSCFCGWTHKLGVESVSFANVGHINAHVVDSGNLRPGRFVRRGKRQTDKSRGNEGENAFHPSPKSLAQREILSYEFRRGEGGGAVRGPGRWACSKSGRRDYPGGKTCL